MIWCSNAAVAILAGAILPTADVQELVYTTAPANNGAGPLWCYGSTCLVRHGDEVYIAGLQTVPERKPLNNTRWVLYHRTAEGWRELQADPAGLQREPCPLVVTDDGRLFLSTNPTTTPLDTYNGPAAPDVLLFDLAAPTRPPTSLSPRFSEPVTFTEHSYRGFAGDGRTGEVVLFNILGYDRYYWSFRDRQGAWSAGRLDFPIGTEYERPVPIRCCYPEIVVKGRAVYLMAVSDIVEPVTAWREYKQQITGQKWDYDFRRLFYTWTPDITAEPFRPWVELASREQTAGHIANLDLLVDDAGNAHALWREQSVWNTKLRDKFFPDVKQTQGLYYGIVRDGKVVTRTKLLEGGEGIVGEVPSYGRLHLTPDNRLFALYWCSGTAADGRSVNENRLVELLPDGEVGQTVRVPFNQPFTTFMTATPRGGSKPSNLIDLYGTIAGADGLWYGRVDLGGRLAVDFETTVERTATGARLSLDGSNCRSLDGAITSWQWDVAGRAAAGERAVVELERGGPATVVLTITDAAGQKRQLRRTVGVPLAPADLGLREWGLVLRTEAEGFAAEQGGAVQVRTDKLAASGLSLSHWNSQGHWLEWQVDVPAGDSYFVVARYATPEQARRQLSVDGKPVGWLSLPPTGGYGSTTSDHWSHALLRAEDGNPLAIRLTAGRHLVRLANLDGAGCNLDYLEWLAASVPFRREDGTLERTEGNYRYLLPLTGALAPSRLKAELGACYTVGLGSAYPGDGLPDTPASRLRLFEDGRELGPAHALHADIRAVGQGRFSHWKDVLYFSASDNSDPRTNGRTYTWRLVP